MPERPGRFSAAIGVDWMISALKAIKGLAASLYRDRTTAVTAPALDEAFGKAAGPSQVRADGTAVEEAATTSVAEEEAALKQRYIRREKFIIVDLVQKVLPPETRFVILDGGAREALNDPRWGVFDPWRVTLYGFEVDPAECETLNRLAREKGLDYRYFPVGLWSDDATLPFHENRSPGGSSFYVQNTGLTDRWKFHNFEAQFLAKDIFHPVRTVEARVTSLKRWAADAGIDEIDFMKLNVQGAELEILKGAGSLLDRTIGVQAEVSFVESYRDRPMFSDIDSFLRRHGFAFFDLIGHHYIGRARSPITTRHCPGLYPLWGQLIEGHGVYFKDPIEHEAKGWKLGNFSTAKVLKLAGFAEIYGNVEYSFELLGWLKERLSGQGEAKGSTDVAHLIEEALAQYRRYVCG